jgi:hypothetical protein
MVISINLGSKWSKYSQMEGKGEDESQKMGVENDLRKVKQKL